MDLSNQSSILEITGSAARVGWGGGEEGIVSGMQWYIIIPPS